MPTIHINFIRENFSRIVKLNVYLLEWKNYDNLNTYVYILICLIERESLTLLELGNF